MITPIPYQNNAKKHPADQLYKLALSIRDFGWRQPIVLDKDHVIVVGHGRWAAYEKYKEEMNLPEPKIDIALDLSEDQVKAYRLADNTLASTDYDMDAVNAELSQIPLFSDTIQFGSFSKTEKEEAPEQGLINDEGYLDYLNQSIRQVVCLYPQEEYVTLMEKCEELYKVLSCENNSELFARLVNAKYADIKTEEERGSF